jgi:hypothetical protein
LDDQLIRGRKQRLEARVRGSGLVARDSWLVKGWSLVFD